LSSSMSRVIGSANRDMGNQFSVFGCQFSVEN
jgi:hypothetical protein